MDETARPEAPPRGRPSRLWRAAVFLLLVSALAVVLMTGFLVLPRDVERAKAAFRDARVPAPGAIQVLDQQARAFRRSFWMYVAGLGSLAVLALLGRLDPVVKPAAALSAVAALGAVGVAVALHVLCRSLEGRVFERLGK